MKAPLIRPAAAEDGSALAKIARLMGAAHEPGYFDRCLDEQEKGARCIFIANGGEGYVQLVWRPLYAPFRRLNIPEIQDLNVVPASRRQGIGAALVKFCEETARQKGCGEIGIGVGLHSRFGAAQRLYVRLGYVPDGAGACYDDAPVSGGEVRSVDDLLTLKLVKNLC